MCTEGEYFYNHVNKCNIWTPTHIYIMKVRRFISQDNEGTLASFFVFRKREILETWNVYNHALKIWENKIVALPCAPRSIRVQWMKRALRFPFYFKHNKKVYLKILIYFLYVWMCVWVSEWLKNIKIYAKKDILCIAHLLVNQHLVIVFLHHVRKHWK
jgi:hypothetical protein